MHTTSIVVDRNRAVVQDPDRGPSSSKDQRERTPGTSVFVRAMDHPAKAHADQRRSAAAAGGGSQKKALSARRDDHVKSCWLQPQKDVHGGRSCNDAAHEKEAPFPGFDLPVDAARPLPLCTVRRRRDRSCHDDARRSRPRGFLCAAPRIGRLMDGYEGGARSIRSWGHLSLPISITPLRH